MTENAYREEPASAEELTCENGRLATDNAALRARRTADQAKIAELDRQIADWQSATGHSTPTGYRFC